MRQLLRLFAVASCLLLLVGPVSALQITEVMYHPPGPDAPNLEWVEIFNDSSTAVDLSGYFFSRGIRFAFEENAFLDGKSYLVVCADSAAVKARYGVDAAVGDFSGRLDNGGERLTLANQNGSPVAEVRYRVGGLWPTAPDGAGYSLALARPYADAAEPGNWIRSRRPGGTPGRENFPPPASIERDVFPSSGPGSAWKYRKGWDEDRGEMAAFSEPPGAWTLPAFDDAGWLSGPAPLGYGESDVATALDDMRDRYLSFAARKTFTIGAETLAGISSLELRVRVDDGCVVYLGGEEVGRVALGGEAGEPVPFDARATSAREARNAVSFAIPGGALHSGENVLAVQVHNSALRSNDAFLAVSLSYRETVDDTVPVPPLRIDEVRQGDAAGSFVELGSRASASLDLSGYFLSRDVANLQAFPLPPGTTVPPAGRLTLEGTQLPFPLDGPRLQLLVTSPDGETVVDAVTLTAPLRLPVAPWSHARLPGDGRFWISMSPTPGDANSVPLMDDVVINEIHYHPLRQAETLEFLELHNRGDRDVVLEGFRLRGGYNTGFGAGVSIEAGGFLVVARAPDAIESAYGLPGGSVVGPPPDASEAERDAFGRLANSGEEIELLDPFGNSVDSVHYGDGGDWDRLADGGGSSLELIDPRQDNATGHAWAASRERHRAPWVEAIVEGDYRRDLPPLPMESELWLFLLQRGECLIDDVSLIAGDPAVEHIPNGGFEEDAQPWRITGTHIRSGRTTAEARSGSAALHLVASGPGDNEVNRVETDTIPSLVPGPVRIRFWARWLGGSDKLHVSGYNNAVGRTVTLPTPLAAGTPGAENSVRRALRDETGGENLGPVVSRLRHSPAVPRPGLPVAISAVVTDADGVASVDVLYRVDSPGEQPPFVRAALLDDGASGDGEPGDGRHAGEIPAGAGGDRVHFFIEATDTAGNSRTYPVAGAEAPLVFVIDDGFAAGAAAENPLLRYRLVVDRRNLSELNTRLLHSDDLLRGTFIFEENDIYYNVGLRFRGSPWGRDNSPKMFRVRFQNDRPFRGEARRINLSRNGSNQEEGTAYHLVRKASVPGAKAPYSPVYEYLNLKLNDRPHSTRPMAEIRPVDAVYARFWWPDEGDAYNWKISAKLAFTDAGLMAEGGIHGTQFEFYGPTKEDVRFYFSPGIRKNDDEFEPVIELLRVMDRRTTPDSEYEARLDEILDVESSLRVFAVRAFLADWDTIGFGPGKNAYLHYSGDEGRHYLLPWDMDHAFGDPDRSLIPTPSSVGLGRLLSFPRYRRLYARIFAENLERAWSSAYIDPWLERIDAVTAGSGTTVSVSLRGFMRARRPFVESFLGGSREIPFAITTPDPSGAPRSFFELRGTAPLAVSLLLVSVNGGDLDVLQPTWIAPQTDPTAIPTTWTATVSGLTPGRNEVELLAIDARGGVAGSASIRLHDTTGWVPPVLATVMPERGRRQGGAEVTLTGSGFRDGVAVLFGGRRAPMVSLVSDVELLAVTPPGDVGVVDVEARNLDGQRAVLEGGFRYEAPRFVRGDVDGDSRLTETDAVAILQALFTGRRLDCADAADVDDDGGINITDPIRLLMFVARGGAAPPAPYPESGEDPTAADPLGCERG